MQTLPSFVDVKPEVAEALRNGRPVCAMESLIIANPDRLELSINREKQYNEILRAKGVTPATIAIIGGRVKIGLEPEEVVYLATNGARKCSRRDIPAIIAKGLDGATTVTGTMIFAAMAGINTFATGGIGGVHRGAQRTFDISADMQELGRTSVAVVASGCKSILDIPLTLEYLETMGVTVVGYKTDEFPSFFARTSGHMVDYRADNGTEVAKMLAAKRALSIPGGLLVCNPILEKDALDFHEMDRMINEACEEAERDGVGGKELTPYLLEAVVNKSEGRSQLANQALIENNVSAAGDIAVAMAEQGL